MALLFLDGFEEYGTLGSALQTSFKNGVGWSYFIDQGGSGMGLTSSIARTSQPAGVTSKSVWGNNWATGTGVQLKASNALSYYLGYGFYDTATAPNQLTHLMINTGDTRGVNIERTANYGFVARAINGGATLATSNSFLYSPNAWHYFEVYMYAHASAGQLIIRINNVEVFNQGSLNTLDGGTNISSFFWKLGTTGPGANQTGYLDDVYLCDSTGTVNNNFLGPISVQTLIPTAAGDLTEFAPSSGNNFSRVATIPESISSYVSISSPNKTDLYNVSDLTISGTSIPGVQINARSIKLENGARIQKTLTKVGGTTSEGPSWNVSMGSYVQDNSVFETQPGGSNWDTTAVNSMQIGIKT